MQTGSGSVKSQHTKDVQGREGVVGPSRSLLVEVTALQAFSGVCKAILLFSGVSVLSNPEFAVPSALGDRPARRFAAGSLRERTGVSRDRRGQPGPAGVDLKRGESAAVRS